MIIQLKIQKNWSYSAYIEILITPGLPTGCLSRKKQKNAATEILMKNQLSSCLRRDESWHFI
jgi:hypothetical protein